MSIYFLPSKWLHLLSVSALIGLWSAATAHAEIRTLDSAQSPIRVEFDTASARLSVLVKSTNQRWINPTSGGGTAFTVTGVTQIDSTHLSAQTTSSLGAVSISLLLEPGGDLLVTLSADPSLSVPTNVRYPYAFLPPDGSGFMVMPLFSGYVVPTTQTTWAVPSGHSRLEWFGGVDSAMDQGWMMIAEPAPAADMELGVETVTIAGQSRRVGVFKWDGSNANASGLANRFSYDRTARIRFFDEGGYVAQTKAFRAYAQDQGWLVTLQQKAQSNPDVERMLGAPVIYLWGDGRSTALLDGLAAAGIDRATIQISINHVDHQNAFPNQAFAGTTGWSDAVRAHGFMPGIYDIYARYSAAQASPPFNGFFYLWPTNADPEWMYITSDGVVDAQSSVSNAMAAPFARDVRLPSHNATFAFDAYFSDVVCATMPREDYDTSFGHFSTREQDIAARVSLLAAISQHHNKIAGVEQIKSWAVPNVH